MPDRVIVQGQPPADQRVTEVWILVAITAEGGEGVYSQTIGQYMHTFVCTELAAKDILEDFLREGGTVQQMRESNVRLEWRLLGETTRVVEIT